MAAGKRDMFITHMAMFWWRQTEKTPSYTTDTGTNERSGDFLEFITRVADIMGIDSASLPDRFARLKQDEPIYNDLK